MISRASFRNERYMRCSLDAGTNATLVLVERGESHDFSEITSDPHE